MKKLISIVSALAIMASFAVNFTASAETYTEPTVYLDVTASSEELKAGDTITINCMYAGFQGDAYDESMMTGNKLDNYGIKITLPGNIGRKFPNPAAPVVDGLFNFVGSSLTKAQASGTATPNLTAENDYVSMVAYGITDAMPGAGKLFTATLVLQQDATTDLTFALDTTYDQMVVSNAFEWGMDLGKTIYKTVADPLASVLKIGAPVTLELPKAADPVLTGITLATDAETVAANTAVTFPAVTANYDIKDPEAVTAAWTLNGEAVTEFTTPAATFEDQTFVFTATYEGKTATYTVTVKALEFAATSPVGADMYFSKDGETSKVVKTFDCSVANCEDGLVTLTFAADGKTKAYENFEVAEGEATTEFKALIFNAPAGVTLTIAD